MVSKRRQQSFQILIQRSISYNNLSQASIVATSNINNSSPLRSSSMPVELGNLREYIIPTYFSWASYCVVVLYVVAGVVFVPFTVILRHREEDKFQCNFSPDTQSTTYKDEVTKNCYTKYDEQYNSPVPLYGILFSSLASVLVVCFIYSSYMRTRAKSRVAPIINAEAPTQRIRRRVFYLYLLHLVTRLGLMISITAVSFYPSGFPMKFDCVSPGKQQKNSTHFNTTDTLSCHTSGSVSRDKVALSICVWVINIFFILCTLVEIAYLVRQASCESQFAVDRKFMAEYFANRTSTLGYSEHLKQTTLRETEKLERFIDHEEERTIDDVFIDLELEARSEDILDDYEELYLPNETTRESAKVLIIGDAGTGKSLLCQKLMRDWSKKSQDSRFDFAFLFKFRCYNKTENISLRQLLNPAPPLESELENVIRQLLDNPEKILLIFDGLDEFRDHGKCRTGIEDTILNKADEKMPVSLLYMKLLQNKLLRGATVLTTSSPHVTPKLISLFDRIVDIKEFSKEKVEKCVSRYCKQHPIQVTARITQHIKNNSDLLSLCAIPLYCHALCYLLMKEAKRAENPESAASFSMRNTEIYKRILALTVSKHRSEHGDRSLEEGIDSFPDVVEQALQKLGILARKGIPKNRTFLPKEVKDITTHFGLLKRTKEDNANPCFCFILPVFRDFLAARTIVNSHILAQDIEKIIGRLRKGKTNWYSVIQSVAGLLHNRRSHSAVNQSLTSCLQSSLSSNDPKDRQMALLMMKCFYEYNDDNLVETAMRELQNDSRFSKRINLENCSVKPAENVDCRAIVYVLKHLQGLQYSVDLSDNSIDELGCKELAKLVQSGGPTSLDLSNNKISDEALGVLTKATRSKQSNIKHLNITFVRPTRPTN